MTLVEIARALGVQTTEEIADECGFEPGEFGLVVGALEAEMARPTLVLDFRGGSDAEGRWLKAARVGPLPPAALPRRLDPRTGLAVESATKRRARQK